MVLLKTENIVRTMLSDTILALCRNTLPYNIKFSVEGLLGITIDDKDIFLVNINEIIQKEGAAARKREGDRDSSVKSKHSESNDSGESSQDEELGSTQKKRRRKRKRSKEKQPEIESSEIEESDTNMSGVFPNQPSNNEDDSTSQQDNKFYNLKTETVDSDEIVFIKEEPSDSTCSYGGTARPSQSGESSQVYDDGSGLQLQDLAMQLSGDINQVWDKLIKALR